MIAILLINLWKPKKFQFHLEVLLLRFLFMGKIPLSNHCKEWNLSAEAQYNNWKNKIKKSSIDQHFLFTRYHQKQSENGSILLDPSYTKPRWDSPSTQILFIYRILFLFRMKSNEIMEYHLQILQMMEGSNENIEMDEINGWPFDCLSALCGVSIDRIWCGFVKKQHKGFFFVVERFSVWLPEREMKGFGFFT